jgi:3-oxoacyl-[acyl-carrier-protein] synthase-1
MNAKSLNIADFGIACSLGASKDAVWQALLSCDVSGITQKKIYGTEYNLALLNGKQLDINHVSELALEPIAPAIEKAISKFGKKRVAVLCGTCYKGSNAVVEALGVYKKTGKFPDEYEFEMQQTDYPAKFIAKKFGLEGIAISHSTACASSASAIMSARNLLEAGLCDAVIAGGTDIVSDCIMLGFSALEAISPKPCNPFSKNRSGITLGEGAAFFLLTLNEEFSCALRIIGCGESADAEHITAPRADGEGAKNAMKAALANAGLKPEDIDYLNLHGTGTTLNDAMESIAVSAVFPGTLPVSSTKSLTGHTLGAAGALELAFCCLALSPKNTEKFLPPHLWDGVFDPELPQLNFVSKGTKSNRLKRCISNSFAFGGYNASIIVESA